MGVSAPMFFPVKLIAALHTTPTHQEFVFFSVQLLLNIPVFELNVPFAFHWTRTVDVHSIVEFLQLTSDFPASDSTIGSSVYIFPTFSYARHWASLAEWFIALWFSSPVWGQESGFDSRASQVVVGFINSHFARIIIIFYEIWVNSNIPCVSTLF